MGGNKIIVGFKTVVLGLSLYIVELLSLPVFGILQKAQVSGQGFHSDFWEYAGELPYPVVFLLTAVIIVMGLAFIFWGLKEKK